MKPKPKAKAKVKAAKLCWMCQLETEDWGTKSECRPCNNDKESCERDQKKEKQWKKEAAEKAKAAKKAEKHAKKYRKLLDLSTGEWELLDEDDKEDLVDSYYAEKNRVAKAEKNRVRCEQRADQTEGEKEEACRKRNIAQKAYRQPRKDDDNFKRRDARAGRSKEEKEEDNRKRKIAQKAYRQRVKKAKVAEALKAREVAEALKALEVAGALKALGFTKRPRFYCSPGPQMRGHLAHSACEAAGPRRKPRLGGEAAHRFPRREAPIR